MLFDKKTSMILVSVLAIAK